MSITISAPEALDDQTVEALSALALRSNRAEGLDLTIPPEVGATMGLLLAHRDGELVGAASISYGYHGHEVEAILCVDPARRRLGVGRALVLAARDQAAARGADKLLFVVDTAGESGRAFAEALGAHTSFAEHRLDLDPAAVPPTPAPLPGFSIRPASPADASAIIPVLVAAFGDPPAMVERFVSERLVSRAHRFLLGELDGRPVGTLRLNGEDGWLYVTTFGVLPELHGRGVGRRLLLYAIAMLRGEGREAIRIEVETTNAPAIGLYEACGFRRSHTFAYLMLPDLRDRVTG